MDIERIRTFFLESKSRGWVASAPKMIIPGSPMSKGFSFYSVDLSFFDEYYTLPGSNLSFGTTTICVAGRPVWTMHYNGWYEKWVIPFLKRALLKNYDNNIFLGGRGPERLEGEDHTLQYLNKVEQNDFDNFWGCERTISTSDQSGAPAGQKLGEYRYFGGLWR